MLFGLLCTQKAPDQSPCSGQSAVITDHESRTAPVKLHSKAWLEAHTVCSVLSPVFPKPLQDKAEKENAAEETDETDVRAAAAFQCRCGGVMEPPPNSGDTQALGTSQPGKVGMQLLLQDGRIRRKWLQGKSETV